MPQQQQDRSISRQQRILDAALAVFARRGYGSAKIDDIAGASNTSKGGVYFHFASKQAIFAALLDRSKQRLLAKVDEAIALHDEPVARADAALLAALRTFGAHRTLARLLLVEAFGAGREFQERLLAMHEELIAVIARHLDDAVGSGAIAPLDTRVAARVWFGALNEVIMRWLVAREPERLEDAYTALRPLLLRSIGAGERPAAPAARG